MLLTRDGKSADHIHGHRRDPERDTRAVPTTQKQPRQAPRFGKMPGVDLWAPGEIEGETYDAALVAKLVENFARFSEGDSPYLPVPLVVGHEEEQRLLQATGIGAAGWLTKVWEAPGAKEPTPHVWGDIDHVHPIAAEWMGNKTFRRPSIEFYRNFRDRDGREWGPTIRRVVMTGGQQAKVKGIEDFPVVLFAEFGQSEIGTLGKPGSNTVDRTQMIAALQAAGLDTAQITDAVPDALLMQMIQMAQAKAPVVQNAEAGTGPTNTNGQPNQQQPPIPGVPGVTAPPPIQPTQLTVKFSEGDWRQMQGSIASLTREVQTLRAETTGSRNASKRERIDTFCQRMVREGKIQPHEYRGERIENGKTLKVPTIVDTLMALPEDQIHQFAEGQPPASLLDITMRQIEQRQPYQSFAEGFTDGTGSSDGTTGRKGVAGTAGVAPERIKALMGASQLGRAISGRRERASKR